MAAVVQHQLGGPEILRTDEVPIPAPGPGEVLVRISRSVVNFADEWTCRTGVNHFTGRRESLPLVPGGEVAGTRYETGERVVALCRAGGYAQFATAPESAVFSVPAGIDDEAALSVFVPGLTAAFLLQVVGLPADGASVVIHGASGAVGTILLNLLRDSDCRVIATVSGPVSLAAPEATAVIDAAPVGLAERIRNVNGGAAVDVVLDSVGGPVLEESLAAVASGGRLVTYGNASGTPATVDPRSLIIGSRGVIGFWLLDHVGDRAASRDHLGRLFGLLSRDALCGAPSRTYALGEVTSAMRATRERGTNGRILLDPWC